MGRRNLVKGRHKITMEKLLVLPIVAGDKRAGIYVLFPSRNLSVMLEIGCKDYVVATKCLDGRGQTIRELISRKELN